MGAPPYALSISHFVSSVGADAGFAAIVGLAILVLLYFAQARETASLRDRFAEAAEQVRQLELRVAHLSRPAPAEQAAVAPRPAAAAAPVASRAASRVPLPVSAVPMAPAGVGAPALSAATRMVPSGDQGAISIRSGAARVGAAGAAAGAGAGVALAGESRDAPSASGGGGVMAPPGPGPATAAGAAAGTGVPVTGGNGTNGGAARTPAPAPAGAPLPSGRSAQPSPGAGLGAPARPGQDPARPYRIAGSRPPGTPPPGRRPAPLPTPPKRSGLRRALIVIAGLILVAAVVAVLVVVTSTGGSTGTHVSSTPAISNAPSATHHRRAHAAALKPAQVTVAVLNGTATSNLAHDVSLKLTNVGYKPGTIATATDQTQTATTVGYRPGEKAAALIVARSLNLGLTAIVPVTSSNLAVACPQAACTAQVVVTVGSDLNSVANSSSAAVPASSSTTP